MAFLQVPQEFANKTTDQIVAEAGTGGLPLLPPGSYSAVIVASDLKDNSARTGQFLELKLVITAGQYKDTEFTERLNIINQNDTAVKIAYQTLGKIAKAIGLQTIPQDTKALHNKPLLIKLKTENGTEFKDKVTGELRQGKDKSVIAGYEQPVNKSQSTADYLGETATTSGDPLPWQQGR